MYSTIPVHRGTLSVVYPGNFIALTLRDGRCLYHVVHSTVMSLHSAGGRRNKFTRPSGPSNGDDALSASAPCHCQSAACVMDLSTRRDEHLLSQRLTGRPFRTASAHTHLGKAPHTPGRHDKKGRWTPDKRCDKRCFPRFTAAPCRWRGCIPLLIGSDLAGVPRGSTSVFPASGTGGTVCSVTCKHTDTGCSLLRLFFTRLKRRQQNSPRSVRQRAQPVSRQPEQRKQSRPDSCTCVCTCCKHMSRGTLPARPRSANPP